MANNLSWAEFKKRFENNLRHVYTRIKNDRSFRLIEPDAAVSRLRGQMADGVTFFPTGVLIVRPGLSKKGNLARASRDTENILYPKKYSTFKNFLQAVRQYIPKGVDEDRISAAQYPLRMFLVKGNVMVEFNKLEKDTDFGGRLLRGEKRSIYWGRLGDLVDRLSSSYKLNFPSPTEQGEADFIDEVNREITAILEEENLPSIPLTIGNKTFDNIVGVNKVQGTVKADLAFVGLVNGDLQDVAWFSHKQGFRASHFQQWGGVTHYADDKEGADESLDKFPEIRAFAKYLSYFCGAGMQYDFKQPSGKGFTAMMEIEDNALKMESVYGKNFGTSRYGVSNCHGVLQGNPSIRKVGRKYELQMSAHLVMNPTPMTGDYEPVLMLINKGDRSQYGIQGARVVVQPRASRAAKFIVSKDRKGNYQMHPVS
jgi:hypothetical protein